MHNFASPVVKHYITQLWRRKILRLYMADELSISTLFSFIGVRGKQVGLM